MKFVDWFGKFRATWCCSSVQFDCFRPPNKYSFDDFICYSKLRPKEGIEVELNHLSEISVCKYVTNDIIQ